MAQIRGTAGYHLGNNSGMSNFGPTSSSSHATNDPSPLDAIREQTSKIEDLLDTYSDPVKPYLPAIGRFLIVVTFLEDALRIMTQWNDQLDYLHNYRYSEYLFPTRGNDFTLEARARALARETGTREMQATFCKRYGLR
jgi:hypothetical protein